MDPTKKRKLDENGVVVVVSETDHHLSSAAAAPKLDRDDARKIIERFSPDQLIEVLLDALSRHSDVLDAVRSIADPDTAQRKLFIRGLGWDTTTEGLRSLFSAYGELEEAIVILDKNTGKSKGYGFVTFKHVDAAYLALKEPSKKIDGRMTVTQLAAAGNQAGGGGGVGGGGSSAAVNPVDVSLRKIYVANVPYEMAADKLLAHFAQYGEVEEGPLGFDKQTGKCKGYALFVYKTPEGAQKALVDPIKNIEGRQLNCKFASEGKKPKMGGDGGGQGNVGGVNAHGDGMGMAPPSGMQGGYGGPGFGYGGFSGGQPMGHHPLGGPGLSSVGNQGPGGGGYGSGLGGAYNYGGPGSGGYGLGGGGGLGGVGGGLGGGGPGSGAGTGSSLYGLPPSSGGLPSGRYPEGGPYGLSAFQNQHHQPGTSPLPRVPPGGMYPNAPYY